MTPGHEQKTFEKYLEDASGSEAAIGALMIALCHPESNRLEPSQKADIFTAGMDAIKALHYMELCQMIVKSESGKLSAEQIAGRVSYAGTKAAATVPKKLELFFNRCEMLKP